MQNVYILSLHFEDSNPKYKKQKITQKKKKTPIKRSKTIKRMRRANEWQNVSEVER